MQQAKSEQVMQVQAGQEPTKFQRQTASFEETIALGAALGHVAQAGDIVILAGDLGAGKTQFSKGFARGFGITEDITSPTFNIMLTYENAEGQVFNHFDLYRLDEVLQLEDIDYFAHLESDATSVVEWGDKFVDALPLDYLEISLRLGEASPDTRVLQAAPQGIRAARLLAAWHDALRAEGI